MSKVVFLTWTNMRHSQQIAEHMGIPLLNVVYGESGRGGLLRIMVRYPIQTWRSLRVLLKHRPDFIVSENPPIFNPLVAYLYGRLFGAKLILNDHTGAHIGPWGRYFGWLHRYLASRAAFVIFPNAHFKPIIEGWGGQVLLVGYAPGKLPMPEPYPMSDKFNVAVISSFAEDEPHAEIFSAARHTPDVHYYITGNPRRLDPTLHAQKPDNVTLTGFLPDGQFFGMLQGADAVMVLTTRDHTLLMGGWEAIAMRTPLITSHFDVLKQYFYKGAVHVDNTATGIADGVRQAQASIETMRNEIVELDHELTEQWAQTVREFRTRTGMEG